MTTAISPARFPSSEPALIGYQSQLKRRKNQRDKVDLFPLVRRNGRKISARDFSRWWSVEKRARGFFFAALPVPVPHSHTAGNYLQRRRRVRRKDKR